jgi:transcriptional regulator with GAF, ATPase, and Fis domain
MVVIAMQWPSPGLKALIPLILGAFVMSVISAFHEARASTQAVTQALSGSRIKTVSAFLDVAYQLLSPETDHNWRITLFMLDETQEPARLEQIARSTTSGESRSDSTSMTIHQGVAGRAYRSKQIVAMNVASDPIRTALELGFTTDEARQQTQRGSFLCVPIWGFDKYYEDKVIGVLCLDAAPTNAFTPETVTTVETLTPFLARILTEE